MRFTGPPILDLEGRPIQLEDLGSPGTVRVIVFLRHFGCIFCRQQVQEWRSRRSELDARRVGLVFVGNGTVEHAKAFIREFAITEPVYTDPTREAYCALELKEGVATAIGIGVMKSALKAFVAGHRQSKNQGEPLQQGGVFVIDGQAEILYRFVSQKAGDHPDPNEVLNALPKVAA